MFFHLYAFVFNVHIQSIKEPLPDSPGASPSAESAHGSSTGMLQYLQSWFPGWGGWYGYTQQPYEGEPFEGLLPDPQEQWNPEDILGMTVWGSLFLSKAAHNYEQEKKKPLQYWCIHLLLKWYIEYVYF